MGDEGLEVSAKTPGKTREPARAGAESGAVCDDSANLASSLARLTVVWPTLSLEQMTAVWPCLRDEAKALVNEGVGDGKSDEGRGERPSR